MSSYMIPIRARERDIADSKSFRSKGQKNGSLLQIEIKPKDCGLLDFQFEDLTVGCDIDLCDYQPSDLVEFPDCDCLACRDCLKRKTLVKFYFRLEIDLLHRSLQRRFSRAQK